jgi:amidase
MTARPPTTEQLRKIADGYGFHFDESELESYRGLIETVLNNSYQQIEHLAEVEPPPVKYPRSSGHRPDPEESRTLPGPAEPRADGSPVTQGVP